MLVALFLIAAPANADEQQTPPKTQQVIVVVGAPGSPKYAGEFQSWADQWEATATQGGLPCEIISQESHQEDTVKDRFLKIVTETSKTKSAEPLWLVLIGHGTWDGRSAMFNLPGPDVSSRQLAEALKGQQRPLVIINCSSSSAPFINNLSGENRVIVTATKSGAESQYSRFGRYFADAIGSLDADLDRDGQTSLREAWLVADAATAEFYESEGRLATEHSLLDDNGDQVGSASSNYENGRVKETLKDAEKVDGKLSARWHLIRSPEEQKLTSEQRQQRDALEAKLEALRRQKDSLEEAVYLDRLEEIMIPLAKLYAQ